MRKTSSRRIPSSTKGKRGARSARRECLNHLVLFGLGGLQRALDQYRVFFNEHRAHQGIGNRIPDALRSAGKETIALPGDGIIQPDEVRVQEFLGGLLKSYSRKAA